MAGESSISSQLVLVLLDKSAPFGDRHDAAMDLGGHDSLEVERALMQVAADCTEENEIADAAGESLWSMWVRAGNDFPDFVSAFHPEARKFFVQRRA